MSSHVLKQLADKSIIKSTSHLRTAESFLPFIKGKMQNIGRSLIVGVELVKRNFKTWLWAETLFQYFLKKQHGNYMNVSTVQTADNLMY